MSSEKLGKELQALYESCLADGLTPAEIRHVARPFVYSQKRRRSAIVCTAVVLLLLLLRESIEWRLCMCARLLMIALLPYWNWMPYHYATCLVNNPFFNASTISISDCQVCEDLRGVARADGFEPQALLEDFVDNLVPLVVREDMSRWPSAATSFSITNVTQAYLEDRDLKAAAVCNFRSNSRLGFDAFLRSFSSSSGWFAHWENCDRSGQKHLRQFYRKPSFLPLAFEMTRPNWVIASRGFSGRRFKELDFEAGSTLVWFAQVKGLSYIRLVPESICSGICQELELLLDASDILLVHTSLWRVHYLPGEDSENIAFAAGCFVSE